MSNPSCHFSNSSHFFSLHDLFPHFLGLTEILERPKREQAFVLIPVGYPAPDCRVPHIQRKPFDDICIRVE